MAALAITDFDRISYSGKDPRLSARQSVYAQELRKDLADSLKLIQPMQTKRQKRRNRRK